MSEPVHDCARCKSPVRAQLVDGPDFAYFWFECKKCKLKWAMLRPPSDKPKP